MMKSSLSDSKKINSTIVSKTFGKNINNRSIKFLNSDRDTYKEENSYKDLESDDGLYKLPVPTSFNKYKRFSIKQVRDEIDHEYDYGEQPLSTIRNKKKSYLNPNTDFNIDYSTDDWSRFKITFDKDSTTVTDMNGSGFSFIETKEGLNSSSYREAFTDEKKKRESLNHILPVIYQYRRMMRSPGSISEIHSRGYSPVIL